MGKRSRDAFGNRVPLASDAGQADFRARGAGEGAAGGGAPSRHADRVARRSAFDVALQGALSDGHVSSARTLVADAEAVLAAHEAAERAGHASADGPGVTRQDLATAKARIALATGDAVAAHAILVQAIESHPDGAALKAMMAEVMLATGRATDIRPVLHHLGRAPAIRPEQPAVQIKAVDDTA